MRLQGRAGLGFYPTPDRVVKAVARMLKCKDPLLSIVDAGAGKGDALMLLRDELQKSNPQTQVKLFGVELDKNRAEECTTKFQQSGGYCLWSAVEDAGCNGRAGLLYYNPPYDTVAGEGRLEEIMLHHCEGWLAKDGLMIAVLPRQALMEDDEYCTSLAKYLDSKYTVTAYQFPKPEYEVFKQFVLFCVKDKDKSEYGQYGFSPPNWLVHHGVLRDNNTPQYEVKHFSNFQLKRDNMSVDLMKYAIEKCGFSGFLLNEAAAHATKIEQPLLPLKEGHLALALAGGLCDGVVKTPNGKFLLKGSLSSEFMQVAEKQKFDKDGNLTHDVKTFRTTYRMLVRCLLENGMLEDYNSHDDELSEEQLIEKEGEEQEEEGGSECRTNKKTQNRLRRAVRRDGR